MTSLDRRPLSRSLLLLFSACVWTLAAAGAGAGEPAGKKEEKKKEKPAEELEENFDVYLDEEEDADRLLRLAARYAESRKWKLCLEKYLECMRLYGGRLTRAGSRDRELYLSVSVAVRREMARVPKEGRQLWRLLKGGRFRSRVRVACARGSDPDELARIARDFAGLKFTARALLYLGEARYARGDAAGAVAAWRRLLREYPDGDYPRIKVLGRAGLAAAEAGLSAEARAILARLRKESALAEVSAGGKPLRLVDGIEKRLAAAERAAGTRSLGSGPAARSLMGGDATHNRPARPIVRPTVLRWRRQLPVPAGWGGNPQLHYLRRYGMQVKKTKSWPFPAYHPAAAGELVFVSGDLGVTALRAHDGEVAWGVPKGEKGVAVGCGLAGPALTGRSLVVRQGRLILGSGYGYRNVSSSSGLLLLEALTGKKLGEKERIQSPLEIPKDDEEGDPEAKGPDGVEVNVPRGAAQPGKRTQFTGVPVLAEGRVYCGLIRRSTQPEYELASFDPKSGKLLWRVFLCGAAPVRSAMPANMGWGGMQGMPLSEIGQPLAVAGRTIYVVTNLGAVAAADADDGRLKWLRLYPRYSPGDGKVVDRRNVMMGRGSYQSPDRGTADMWEPCAPVLTGGLLIAAPQDCDYLLAIDAETGRLVWRAPRVGLRRLLGAVDGKVVLSGADQVVVRDVANGRALWRRRLSGRVVGHGAMGKDYVALSTTKALEVLNLSGKPLFQYKWKDPKAEAGNVLVHGENVYTVSATHINAYCDLDEITKRLVAEARKKPGAALPRFLTGALELAGGRREQAIATLKEALERVKPRERYAGAALAKAIRGKLWQCHWQGAQEAIKKKEHEAALRHLDLALKCSPDAEHAPRTLLARANCLEKLARPAETLGAYQKLLAEYPEAPCERPDGSRLRTWLLAKGEIARLLEKSGPEAYAKYEERAAELLAEARESGKGELAQKLVALYPNSKSAGQALLLAAELAAKAGRYDVELRCLRRHIFLQGGLLPSATEARARLAVAYARRGYIGAARQIARQLAATGGKLTVDGKEVDPAKFALPPRPAAKPPLVEKWRVKLEGASLVPGCAGDSQLVLIGTGRITAVNAGSGKMLWSFEPEKAGLGKVNPYQYPGREQVRIDGDAVVISIGRKRAALDRTTGKLRWKTEVRTDQTQRYYGGQYTGGGRGRSSAADGVLACRESVSKTDQLGNGEQRKLVRALSVDDGKELWTLLLARQENTGRSYYYGQGSDGLGRTGDGRLVAWAYKPQTYRPKRTKQKTTFMIIDATTGKVTRRFEAKDVAPVGLFRDRLVCRDRSQKMAAFNLDGKKAWVGTGRWQLLAASDEEGKLIVSTQVRSGGVYRQDIAAIDARGGKLLWKHSSGSGQTSRYYRSNYNQRLANILPDRLIMLENVSYTYYNPYAQRMANLKVWDMKSGKVLWKTPFVPTGHTRAAGRKHLACAFMKVEQLGADGKVIVRRRDRWGRVQGQQVEVKAMRVSTVVRLFDLDGGKALWEWVETKRIEAKDNQPVWTWYRGRAGGRVSATARGLLVSTPDSVVLLAPAENTKPAPRPDVKPDK